MRTSANDLLNCENCENWWSPCENVVCLIRSWVTETRSTYAHRVSLTMSVRKLGRRDLLWCHCGFALERSAVRTVSNRRSDTVNCENTDSSRRYRSFRASIGQIGAIICRTDHIIGADALSRSMCARPACEDRKSVDRSGQFPPAARYHHATPQKSANRHSRAGGRPPRATIA